MTSPMTQIAKRSETKSSSPTSRRARPVGSPIELGCSQHIPVSGFTRCISQILELLPLKRAVFPVKQRFVGPIQRTQSTQRYTRVEISDLREVVRRAHPRGR